MPMPRPPPARPRRGRTGGRPSTSAASLGLLSCHSLGLLDSDENALLGIEEAIVDLRPATDLRDLEETRRGRELLRVLERGQHRAVAIGHKDLLGRWRPQE